MQAGWVNRDEFPFESRWARLSSGTRMHYVDEGSGPAVLFVHGTPTWSFDWRRLVAALSATHRCIAPDHLGFGLSERPPNGAYTPEWHAANLAQFVERLGLDRFTLVVHDFGGPIGLPLALDTPSRVDGLVVFNSWMWSIRDDAAMVRPARLLGGRFGKFLYRRANLSLRVLLPAAYADRRTLTRAVHAQYLAPFPEPRSRELVLWSLAHALLGSDAFYSSLWEGRERLRDLPAQLIWGMHDPAFRPHHLARWREVLPGADVTELPVGHWPLEESPDEVIGAVRAFLRRTQQQLHG